MFPSENFRQTLFLSNHLCNAPIDLFNTGCVSGGAAFSSLWVDLFQTCITRLPSYDVYIMVGAPAGIWSMVRRYEADEGVGVEGWS